MASKRYKRRKYIVDPAFQYSMIRNISLLAAFFVVTAISFLGFVYHHYGDIQVGLLQPDPYGLAGLLASQEAAPTLFDILWPVVTLSLLVSVTATILFGVIYSNRLAGPMVQIHRVLSSMQSGDLTGSIRLREKDSYKNLAKDINNLNDSLKKSIDELKRICLELDLQDDEKKKIKFEQLTEMLASFKTDTD